MKQKQYILAALVVAVVAAIASVGIALHTTSTATEPTPVLFKGAYAVYTGSASSPLLTTTCTLAITIEDCNATHAKMHITVLLGHAPVMDEEEWLSKKNFWSQLGNKTGTAKINGRKCIVYTCSDNETTMQIYIDEKTGWPLQITMNTTEDNLPLSIELHLNQTNIPDLKP